LGSLVGLRKVSIPVKDQKGQRVVWVVTMLGQQRSTNVTLHGHQSERRLNLMTPQKSHPTAAYVAECIEYNQASVGAGNHRDLL